MRTSQSQPPCKARRILQRHDHKVNRYNDHDAQQPIQCKPLRGPGAQGCQANEAAEERQRGNRRPVSIHPGPCLKLRRCHLIPIGSPERWPELAPPETLGGDKFDVHLHAGRADAQLTGVVVRCSALISWVKRDLHPQLALVHQQQGVWLDCQRAAPNPDPTEHVHPVRQQLAQTLPLVL